MTLRWGVESNIRRKGGLRVCETYIVCVNQVTHSSGDLGDKEKWGMAGP